MAKAPPSPASAGSAPGSAPGQPPGTRPSGAGQAPPAPQGGKTPRQTLPSPVPFTIEETTGTGAARIGIYGTGKIGKTTLAKYLPGDVLFIDLEHGTKYAKVKSVQNVRDFATLRGILGQIDASPPPGVRTLVIDSLTLAEELAKDHVVATKPVRERGGTRKASNIEDFPFGSGWQLVFDEVSALFTDIDRIVDRHGLNVCCIAHDCTTTVPNPYGGEFLRYEPRLSAGDKKERGSIRKLFREWCDHLLFISYDIHVNEDGKGVGSGTRTVYTTERPTHLAGSRDRALELPFDLTNAAAIWESLGIS